MNLGTDNRNKTIAALALGGLALIMVVMRIISPAGGAPAASVAPPPVAATSTAAPSQTARPVARRVIHTKKNSGPAGPSLDPTLKMALLQTSESITYTGNARNIFRAQDVVIPTPLSSGLKKNLPPPLPSGPPPPPPPPPIDLKFFGFASKPGEPKRIFLSKAEDVFIAGEGDIVDRRYRILRITPNSVEVEDVLTNHRQIIPLTQG